MTPRVSQLEDLSAAVKKALRAYKHMLTIPDGPASSDLVAKAKEIGLLIPENPSLQVLLEQTQAMIQAEILSEYERRASERQAARIEVSYPGKR